MTRARLRPVCECGVREMMARGWAWEYEHYANAAFAEALSESESFDLIHCHLGCRWIPIGTLGNGRILHTVHTSLSIDDQWLLSRHPDVQVSVVSGFQLEPLPPGRRQTIAMIHHGCDFDNYRPSWVPGQYLAFLGRMSPQKCPLDAIRIAKLAGMPLLLAGRPQTAEEEVYFSEQIEPLIDGTSVKHVGPVDHAQKQDLLRNAGALLFPITGNEAFGLAMIEAMACGTPVVGRRVASTTEVVDEGSTGFLADSVEGMAAVIPEALKLDRRAVHAAGRRRFSHHRMVDQYVSLYESLVATWRQEEVQRHCPARPRAGT